MNFLCVKYPSLGIYANNKRYRFVGGIFNVDEVEEDERPAVIKTLTSLAASTVSEVMREEDFSLPFQCDTCSKRLKSQAALNGHKPAHRSVEEIKRSSWIEGGAPPTDS